MRVEYRITGRFRKDDKHHVVDRDPKWTLTDAQNRLKELKNEAEWEISHKERKAIKFGVIGIAQEYYSDYDLLELRIESRKVSPWNSV